MFEIDVVIKRVIEFRIAYIRKQASPLVDTYNISRLIVLILRSIEEQYTYKTNKVRYRHI